MCTKLKNYVIDNFEIKYLLYRVHLLVNHIFIIVYLVLFFSNRIRKSKSIHQLFPITFSS